MDSFDFNEQEKKQSNDIYFSNETSIQSLEKTADKVIAKKKKSGGVGSTYLFFIIVIIINITGIAYQRDYISGEIVEYPFEEMDPEQILETYQDENNIILEITTNKKQKLTDEEILETIVKY